MTYMSGWLRGLDAWLQREDVGADAAEEAALIAALAGVPTNESDPDGDETADTDEPSEPAPAAYH